MAQTGYTPIQLYYSTTVSAAPVAGDLANGELAINITDGKMYYKDNAGVVQVIATKAGASGDVVGPASATDNAVARYDGTTGKIIQNSVVTIADTTGNMAGVGTLSSGAITSSALTSGRVPYAGTAGLIQDSANLTFDGTNLTVNGTAYLGGTSTTQSLRVTPIASAVNYWNFQGNIAGNTITTAAQGSDTNISMAYQTKGTGSHFFQTGGGNQFVVSNTASAVNYIQVNGAITGSDATLRFTGSDTNVGGIYAAKGAGSHRFFTNDNNQQQFQISHTASAVNYLQVTGGATGVGVALSAQGSDTNITNFYSTKGTGSHSFFTGGGNQLIIANVASAVNAVLVYGSATGTAVQIAAGGSDTNIDLLLNPKGSGYVVVDAAYSPNLTLTDAATITWDTSTAGGQVATFTFVSSNRTMGAPTNLKNGAFYALAVIQNAGSNTLTWNSVFKWAAGTAPTLSTAAGAKDFFEFRSDGTNLYQTGISQAVA